MTRWGKIKWFPLSCTSDAKNKRLKYFFLLRGKPFLFLAQYYVNLPLLFYPYLKKKQSLKKSFLEIILFILFCFDFVCFYIPTKCSPPSSPHSSSLPPSLSPVPILSSSSASIQTQGRQTSHGYQPAMVYKAAVRPCLLWRLDEATW